MKEYYASKDIALQRDNYICQKCGKPALTVAHRIARTKSNIKHVQRLYYELFKEIITLKYAEEIINHQFNLVTDCNGNCNDSYNIGFKEELFRKLLILIHSMKCENLSVKEIEEFLK